MQKDVEQDDHRQRQQHPQHRGPEEGHPGRDFHAALPVRQRRGSHVADRTVAWRATPVGEPAALLLQLGEAHDGLDQVVVGAELEGVDAGAAEGFAEQRLASLGGGGEALAKALVVRVDDDLLAGLGVPHRHQADIGELHLERVEQTHRRHLMALRELAERLFPAGRADEVGDDEDRRAPLDRALRREQQLAQVGRTGRRFGRPRGHALQQLEHVRPAAARRQHGVDVRAVEQGADAVAAPRQEARQNGDELARDLPLREAVRAEVDAGREVDQEPRRQLAVLGELAHVRLLQPRGDIPVDVAHVVVMLVFAQVGEIEAGAAHQRAVVALEQAVETA